jgi:hypothetical protein
MQSLRTGWGIEAEPTQEGKKQLIKIRKQMKDKFKWCRVYMARQLIPEHHDFLIPFRLTSRRDDAR